MKKIVTLLLIAILFSSSVSAGFFDWIITVGNAAKSATCYDSVPTTWTQGYDEDGSFLIQLTSMEGHPLQKHEIMLAAKNSDGEWRVVKRGRTDEEGLIEFPIPTGFTKFRIYQLRLSKSDKVILETNQIHPGEMIHFALGSQSFTNFAKTLLPSFTKGTASLSTTTLKFVFLLIT